MDGSARYREILSKQLAMNPQTWAALQQRGVTEASQVRLDFAYACPNEARAQALRGLLAEQTDYETSMRAERGVLQRRWSVTGRTQATNISAAILDQWVDWMVSAGLEHDCEFDGWGAAVPPPMT